MKCIFSLGCGGVSIVLWVFAITSILTGYFVNRRKTESLDRAERRLLDAIEKMEQRLEKKRQYEGE